MFVEPPHYIRYIITLIQRGVGKLMFIYRWNIATRLFQHVPEKLDFVTLNASVSLASFSSSLPPFGSFLSFIFFGQLRESLP